jgi:hypothetical protein
LTERTPSLLLLLGTVNPVKREIGAHVTLTGNARFAGVAPRNRAAVKGLNGARLSRRSPKPVNPPVRVQAGPPSLDSAGPNDHDFRLEGHVPDP